ncbi:hypothetical protein PPL_03221 [Heterostelium album PN500]|uniref:FG-GAP repeat-containing protein n=1 Tax=Heterostelium pallidum (strain ATCC 26659 / Pp 5 / PN500) TaxID=670386 RepID=D3B499_HETP5|nr:hypothetical protein PPL_03221 [Heterostelium album PN500]EFA84147.1 hypothetical protein PPL_03221 [Heterostelium album PN500]|eukprot:XP_020436264.1 hypothetical protein PPL_03221 [Heterostelium album PN500]
MRQRDAWMILVYTNQYANSHYPQINEVLPNPIITDLDGDGKNDHKIRIVDPVLADDSVVGGKSTSMGKASLRYEVSLASKVGLSSGRRIVALQTGYATPYISRTSSTQLVVVVTEEWEVLVFDHQLKPLWERYVVDEIPKNHYHSEVTIQVVSNGLIIVGGRLEAIPNELHRSHITPAIGIDPNALASKVGTLDEGDPTAATATGETASKEGDAHAHDHEKEEVHRDENHFSFYAFSAYNGQMHWHHDELSFLPENTHADEEHHDEKRHSYKQHVYSLLEHIGEVSWKSYKQSMLAAMPHRWSSKFDTRFQLAHFEKQGANRHNPTKGNNEADWNTEVIGVHPSHFEGLTGGNSAPAQYPHAETDHIDEPNVVIAHTKAGMEVIQLQNGRTLCKLLLDSTNKAENSDHYITYTDLNNDGVVDQVHAIAGNLPGSSMFSRNRRQEICLALGMSGLPPRDYLFNRSICHEGGMDFDYFFWRSSPAAEVSRGAQTVAPAIIASANTVAGSAKLNDVVFLVNSGKITSVRHTGRANWQRDTDARWQKDGQPYPHPSIQAFSLEVYGPKTNLLAVADHIVILDQQGEILISERLGKKGSQKLAGGMSASKSHAAGEQEHYQPTDAAALSVMPMGPPIIGDLNNDGYNDVIVPTVHGYYVYQLERGHSTFILSLFVIIISLAFTVMLYLGLGNQSTSSSHSSSSSSTTSRLFGLNNTLKSQKNSSSSKFTPKNLSTAFVSNIIGNTTSGKRSTD